MVRDQVRNHRSSASNLAKFCSMVSEIPRHNSHTGGPKIGASGMHDGVIAGQRQACQILRFASAEHFDVEPIGRSSPYPTSYGINADSCALGNKTSIQRLQPAHWSSLSAASFTFC